MVVIPATQEAEIRRISVQSQPRQTVCRTLSEKTLHKHRTGGVAQGEGTESKPQRKKKEPGVVARFSYISRPCLKKQINNNQKTM
jgi:hypothetical protein